MAVRPPGLADERPGSANGPPGSAGGPPGAAVKPPPPADEPPPPAKGLPAIRPQKSLPYELLSPSAAPVSQLFTVDKEDLLDKIGALSAEHVEQVFEGICRLLTPEV